MERVLDELDRKVVSQRIGMAQAASRIETRMRVFGKKIAAPERRRKSSGR